MFRPDPFTWLFGAGIGTNLGAAIVWIPIGAALGLAWSHTKGLHAQIRKLHASHAELHVKVDGLSAARSEPGAP